MYEIAYFWKTWAARVATDGRRSKRRFHQAWKVCERVEMESIIDQQGDTDDLPTPLAKQCREGQEFYRQDSALHGQGCARVLYEPLHQPRVAVRPSAQIQPECQSGLAALHLSSPDNVWNQAIKKTLSHSTQAG